MSEEMGTMKILKLMREVELYKQAIQDAKDALEAVETELDDTLEDEFELCFEIDLDCGTIPPLHGIISIVNNEDET